MTRAIQYDYSGKVVCITGGSRGLGHAMALGFAAAGANLAIASRKIDSCEAAVKEIRAMGRDGSAHGIHVGKWDDCNRLYDEVYARWGRCDVLINNAGLSPLYPSLVEHTEDLFDKVIGVNLKGPFRLSALFGAKMAGGKGGTERDYGRIRERVRSQGPRQLHHGGPVPYRYQQGMVAHRGVHPPRKEQLRARPGGRARRGSGRGAVSRESGGELHDRRGTDDRRRTIQSEGGVIAGLTRVGILRRLPEGNHAISGSRRSQNLLRRARDRSRRPAEPRL